MLRTIFLLRSECLDGMTNNGLGLQGICEIVGIMDGPDCELKKISPSS